MKKVGILGGSFDPIHYGHFQLALSLMEFHGLDEVLFVPAKINPLKNKTFVDDHHRLKMMELALDKIPFFKISPIELNRQNPSFTIDTLKFLKNENPNDQHFLLLGDDVIPHFMKWKDPESIVQLTIPLIASRDSNRMLELSHLSLPVQLAFKKGWTPIPILEISSTILRKRLRDNLFCKHLMPVKVLDYIAFHRLYS